MKVLNLYAGIGGNRKLWTECEVTAVEHKPEIAAIYSHFYPNDTVIIGDAHQYLLDHYQEFDFIWASPPCPTHSRFNNINIKSRKYPDMKLWQEIIFLKSFFKGKYCIENVITYYEPLIPCVESDSHYYWTNFKIPKIKNTKRGIRRQEHEFVIEKIGIDLSAFPELDKKFVKQVINNCVQPEMGELIFNCAKGIYNKTKEYQQTLF